MRRCLKCYSGLAFANRNTRISLGPPMTDVSRIKIRYGAIEIEYEGKESFLREELPGFIEAISKLAHPPAPLPPSDGAIQNDTPKLPPKSDQSKLGVNSIAARLDIKTGPDLLLAAAAYLTFSVGKEVFSNQELHDAAKQATAHYNGGTRSNFASYVKSLVKNKKLNDLGTQKYSLSATQRDQIGGMIAGA